MPASNLQQLAFTAMGINLEEFLAVIPRPGSVVGDENATYIQEPISIATGASSAQVRIRGFAYGPNLNLVSTALVPFRSSSASQSQPQARK